MSYSINTKQPPNEEQRTESSLLPFLDTSPKKDSSITSQAHLSEQSIASRESPNAVRSSQGRDGGWGAGGDFGAYMVSKIRRLREAAATVQSVDQLFRGICVWVTGLTNPSSMELRQLIRV